MINNDIDKLQPKNITKTYNFSKQERNALQQLQTRTDLVITNADKGGKNTSKKPTDNFMTPLSTKDTTVYISNNRLYQSLQETN